MPLNVGLKSCGSLCQHPGCWNAVRKQEKGIAKSLPPLDFSSSDDSDSELDLPTQSVCNLLGDFGESPTDRYPLSTGGRPSHQWDTSVETPQSIRQRKESTLSLKKLHAPYNTKASLFSKKKSTGIPAARPRPQPRMPLVEVQEVFDRTDLNSQWDETFVTKQYYMWVANPHQKKKKRRIGGQETYTDSSGPVLVKDMTECMVPPEIEQQREDTVLKKQPRTASPPGKSLQHKKAAASQPLAIQAPPPIDVDMEGINELLALPKDVLLKVLENTKKSDFTSKGRLHEIVQECVEGNDSARMMLSTRELLRQKKMKILNIPKGPVHKSHPMPPKPVFHVDDEQVIDRMSSANTPVKDKDVCSDDSSVESFPRFRKPLPRIQGNQDNMSYHLVGPGELIQAGPDSVRLPLKAKLPSISLGLPELPSGVKTTRAFAYNSNSMVDFTLGPIVSPPTTTRSSESGDYSEHGTTVKVNVPMSGMGYADNDMGAIHSVSPALSTNVPVAPAGTPYTFMSPTKSAPNLRDISRDPTQVTINLSIKAQPSSRDMREATFMSSPMSASGQQPVLLTDTPLGGEVANANTFPKTPDDKGLDTIRETARETGGADGSVVLSSPGTFGDKHEDPPKLILQTSTMTNINTAASPLPKSARSVESCPSPEQWPLISESSFEKMVPRSSISEPALSGRSGRRTTHSRGFDDNGRDYARKVMVEKNTAESPAPPPPSPEPKDSNEYRARKDLKSRESLSMAPLFEVNEIEEEMYDGDRHGHEGRRRQVRKIHAVIPQANIDDENYNDNKNKEPEESEEVMVSQITVMHVAPKGINTAELQQGGTSNREREKVQETFLNVDIPAEEISSCKAEHGSSRQEDLSSNNESAAKSEVTTTNSQVSGSTSATGKENEKEEEENDDDDDEGEPVREEKDKYEHTEIEPEGKDALEETQYLDMQSDYIHRDRTDSAKLNSEDSGVSPELVCDSARFMSHDLVSPMEGEMDEGEMQMMSLLQQVEGRSGGGDGEGMETLKSESGEAEKEVNAGNEKELENEIENEGDEDVDDLTAQYREVLGEESKEEDESVDVEDSGKEASEKTPTSNETTGSDDLEPPGSFFFQANGESDDKDKAGEESGSVNDEGKVENELTIIVVSENGVKKEEIAIPVDEPKVEGNNDNAEEVEPSVATDKEATKQTSELEEAKERASEELPTPVVEQETGNESSTTTADENKPDAEEIAMSAINLDENDKIDNDAINTINTSVDNDKNEDGKEESVLPTESTTTSEKTDLSIQLTTTNEVSDSDAQPAVTEDENVD